MLRLVLPLLVATLCLASPALAQTPGPPTALAATASADNSITLTWTVPSTGGAPTSYVVQVGTTSGASDVLSVQIAPATTYTTAALPIGTTYFARVRAVNGSGVSAPSNEASVTVSCQTPATGAANLSWRPLGATNEVQVVWTADLDLTWTVAVGSAPGLSDVLVSQPTFQKKRTITMTLPAGMNYVRVAGVNSCGAAAPTSAEVAVTAGEGLGSSAVLINEFDGFVELKNVGASTLGVGGWRLLTSTSAEQRVSMAATLPAGLVIAPGCTYLLGAQSPVLGVTPDQVMAASGRSYALTSAAGRILDSVARANADLSAPTSALGEGTILGSLAASASFARLNDEDTNDNAADFVQLTLPTPQNSLACQSGGPQPGPPVSLAAQVSGSTVSLTWSPPSTGSAPTQYLLEAGTATGASNAGVFALSAASTTATFVSVPDGVYYVRLKAMNAEGTSVASNEVVLSVCGGACLPPPQAPTQLSAQVSGSSVLLLWQAPATGSAPTQYLLEAGTAPGLANLVSTSTGSASVFVIVNSVPPGAYYVRIRALNGAGSSAASNEILVVVP